MPGKLFNSTTQHLLVSMHRFASSRLNLHGGLFGRAYRRIYFSYKHIIDRHLIATARKLAKPGTLVVDVGANIGFFSVAVARRADVALLAFEPDHQNYQSLNRVSAENGLGSRIHPYRLALSDRTGTGSLYLSDLAPTDHKLINSRSSRTVEIALTRLDDFFSQHADLARTPVSLIKIDVQGAELLVLRGMRQTLIANNHPPILVEYSPDDLTQAGVTPAEFFGAFEALGYHPHTLPELKPRDPDWFIHNTRGAYMDLAMVHSTTTS
jgi:FkbM family methyltransferase